MADNIYVVENLAPLGPSTIVVTDDGTGVDWIEMSAAHTATSELTLAYYTTGPEQTPTAAAGFYQDFDGPFKIGNRLIVNGIIENARGSLGFDSISGNILGNILYGDPTADGPGGADTLYGDEGNDLIYGGAGNDQINGAEDDDRLFGGAGADTISGSLGRDTVEGGAGADNLTGGADGQDTLSYASSSAGVRVSLTYGTTTVGQGGDAQGDVIGGFNNIEGSEFGDRLVDTDQLPVGFGYNTNTFYGMGGNDELLLGGFGDRGYGGAGNDTLNGQAGRDRLWGDLGSDTVLGGAEADSIWGGAGFDYLSGDGGADTIRGGADRDRIYGGAGNDQIFGDAGNDLIFANEGVDTIIGGDGDDDLAGQAGADVLRGGAGADEFFYFSAADSGDQILDMTAADRIDFQLPFGSPALSWDNTGTLDANRARLVDTGPNIELRINLDADPTIEFRVIFVGAASVSQGQVDL